MKREDFRIKVYVLDCRLTIYEGKISSTTWDGRIDYLFVKIGGKIKRVAKEGWTRRSALAAFLTMEGLDNFRDRFSTFCLVREAENLLGLSSR